MAQCLWCFTWSTHLQNNLMEICLNKNVSRHSLLRAVVSMCTVMLLGSCASDNIHKPDPDAPQGDGTLNINGIVTSSIPDFAFFEPVVADDKMTIEWTQGNTATVSLGEFTIYVSVMNLNITIGDMVIDGVTVSSDEDGVMTLSKPEFECQAGAYSTTGSMSGSYDPATGAVDITYDYKPGSMPFTVKSRFTGNI